MPWGPSAVYEVEHKYGWFVPDLRIGDDVMSHANAGDANYKAKIAIAFKQRLLKDNNGHGPTWVDFADLTFKKLRDVAPGS